MKISAALLDLVYSFFARHQLLPAVVRLTALKERLAATVLAALWLVVLLCLYA